MVESDVLDAFGELGIAARELGGGHRADIAIEPAGILIQLKSRSLVDEDAARRLLVEARPDGSTLVVVGDRVTESARTLLIAAGAGYLDRRGHIALRAGFYYIDADVAATRARPSAKRPFSGKSGLEIAAHILMHPEHPASVRELARKLGRSPSTVSDELRSFQDAGLLDDRRHLVDDRLFWEAAGHWPRSTVYLREAPSKYADDPLVRPLRVESTDVQKEGWALTDTRAALAYQAPVAMKDDNRLDFYVANSQIMGRAVTLLGEAKSASSAECSVRIAPVPAVCQRRVEPIAGARGWPLAHPLFVALDLAQDQGRGREILRDWNPGPRWRRVW